MGLLWAVRELTPGQVNGNNLKLLVTLLKTERELIAASKLK